MSELPFRIEEIPANEVAFELDGAGEIVWLKRFDAAGKVIEEWGANSPYYVATRPARWARRKVAR